MSAFLLIYTELHPAQVDLYTIRGQSDVGTQSLTVIKFLILKEENASSSLRLLQYFLTSIRTHLTLGKTENCKKWQLKIKSRSISI